MIRVAEKHPNNRNYQNNDERKFGRIVQKKRKKTPFMTFLGDLTGRIDSFPYGFTTRRIDATDSRLYWPGGLWLAAQVRLSSCHYAARQYQSINP